MGARRMRNPQICVSGKRPIAPPGTAVDLTGNWDSWRQNVRQLIALDVEGKRRWIFPRQAHDPRYIWQELVVSYLDNTALFCSILPLILFALMPNIQHFVLYAREGIPPRFEDRVYAYLSPDTRSFFNCSTLTRMGWWPYSSQKKISARFQSPLTIHQTDEMLPDLCTVQTAVVGYIFGTPTCLYTCTIETITVKVYWEPPNIRISIPCVIKPLCYCKLQCWPVPDELSTTGLTSYIKYSYITHEIYPQTALHCLPTCIQKFLLQKSPSRVKHGSSAAIF